MNKITSVRVLHTNGLRREYKGIKLEKSGALLYIDCLSEGETQPGVVEEIKAHQDVTFLMLGDGQVIPVVVDVRIEGHVLVLDCAPRPLPLWVDRRPPGGAWSSVLD
jgi:hypothetical protein